MLKQTAKNNQSITKQIQQDIQFLLSNIRARQNGLIFFLQRFTSQCKTHQQYATYKQQFLQKQKIYANQVNRIIKKFNQDKQNQQELKQFIRTFWIKVKSIIKVSLDRLRMLKLLNQKIFISYEQIINIINQNYDEEKNLEQFALVENLLKKRNMDALIYSKNQFSQMSSETKIGKNRSQSAFKQSKFSPKPEQFIQQCFGNQNNSIFGVAKLNFDQNQKETQQRMKSLNGYRRNKILIQSKDISSKIVQKNYKKIYRNIQKTQKTLQRAMDCIIQLPIDKKKTWKQNQQALYDDLFKKNIPNHKMISKFLFGACGIAQLLIKRKNIKLKRIFVSKIQKNNRQSKDFEKVNKTKPTRQQFKQLRQKDKQKQKVKEIDNDKQKQKNKEKQKQRQKNKQKQKSKQRPQSSLTSQIRGIFQQQKRRMIRATLILQDKRNNKYRKKIGNKLQKYSKLVKLMS